MELVEQIKLAKRIVFFGGAGVSTASGILDFRSSNGLYQERYGSVSPEIILSHHYFVQHPDIFYCFLKEKMLYLDADPNFVHNFIQKLSSSGEKVVQVITQNIDGLHQRAGSQNVLELHGNILDYYCMQCGREYDVTCLRNEVPICSCGGIIRPKVILYEEALDDDVIWKSLQAIQMADLMIVIGTSLMVEPAASMVCYFKGRCLAIVNHDVTSYDRIANVVIHDDLVQVFQKLDKALSL